MDKKKNWRIPNWEDLNFLSNTGHNELYFQYMKDRSRRNITTTQSVHSYSNSSFTNIGGVLAPNGKIYYIPFDSASATQWYYININGESVAYSHGLTPVRYAYAGGVLNTKGRIYLVPMWQATATVWHYIDTTKKPGTTGHLVAYSHGVSITETNPYFGGALSPNGNIYLAPYRYCNNSIWHYISSSGAVVAYTHGYGTALSDYGYIGAVLAGDGNIYLSPYYMSTATSWHYINTSGQVIAYTRPYAGMVYGSYGAALSVDGKRVYFIPYGQSTATYWFCFDTSLGSLIAYSHGVTAVQYAYAGGVLAPNGRIYMVPYNQATATVWHYIDTNLNPGDTGHVVAYTHGVSCTAAAFRGGVLSPNGRIYLVPNASYTTSYYINTNTADVFSNNICLSPYLNKY